MSEDTTVRTEFEIDSEVRDRAEKVLESTGMTMPEYLQLAVTRMAEQGALPVGLEPDLEYDAWVKQEILAAIEEDGPFFTTEEVNRHMDEVKADVARKLASGRQ